MNQTIPQSQIKFFQVFGALLFGIYILTPYSHIFTFQNFKTICTSALHLLVGTPGSICQWLNLIQNRRKFSNELKFNLDSQNVIMFVHGRNGHSADFKPLIDNIKQLTNSVYNPITINNTSYHLASVNLKNTGYASIDEDVDKLKEELMSYNNCSITLVGLSKGGITIMRYLTTQNDQRIKKVITISSPIKGTYIGNLFPESSVVFQGLSHDNKISQEIIVAKNKLNVPIHHIVPTWDHLIIPASNAAYDDTPEENIFRYDGMWYGHVGICENGDVAKAIIKWL